ncbi:SDR family NAD(P)-dependent oxidoreductase [Sphingomonas sp. PAMC 26605]|uniref:SDR family NAD(P)-dependent oxidoreductase n=1 Tax=Sphingomonas sp. PAMC 26605 TaxID=1112214 RepID=UPI00026CC627|nr:SDR family NAD(P)-dependent oxidoreductase [Sphingomonas sp. PAMC 26605]
MSKVIIIVGFGPGVSTAVADKFGAEGFSIGLIARSQARLTAGVEALEAKGVAAVAFAGDAGDPIAIRGAIAAARAAFGRIDVLLWNASSGHGVGDLLSVDPSSVTGVFDVAIAGLLAAVQETLPDLKAAGDGAILVTNGALGDLDPAVDRAAIAAKADGIGIGNAAKAKLVGLLAARLDDDGIYVGEVTIAGVVRGTRAAIPGVPMIEGAAVADAFWDLYHGRQDIRVRIG